MTEPDRTQSDPGASASFAAHTNQPEPEGNLGCQGCLGSQLGEEIEADGNTLVVSTFVWPPQLLVMLSGELDLASAERLQQIHTVSLAGISQVEIDLTRLRFCDVAGIRGLLELRIILQCAGRRVSVRGAQPLLLRAARLLGFGQLFGDGPLSPR